MHLMYNTTTTFIIIINKILFYSDTVMNNITGALYTVSGKNNEMKQSAAG